MININGSIGGGQIARTAIGLSAYTGKAFKIINIRKGRKEPGLKEQHLQAVNSVAKLCDAEVIGNKLHSTELTFRPSKITENNLSIKIATAGSVGLVLQALLIPALKADLKISIEGGADFGKWAPPTPYLQYVLLPLLKKMGFDCRINIKRYGFYPKGGSIAEVETTKPVLKPINITEKGKIVSIEGISVASYSLKKAEVAERQANSAKEILAKHFGINPDIKIIYDITLCPGSGIQLWIKTTNSIISGNSLGEIGKKAEIVGREATDSLIFEYENGCIGQHTADQLIPYMAIAGNSSILASKITEHTRTNIEIVKKFLDVDFKIEGNVIKCN